MQCLHLSAKIHPDHNARTIIFTTKITAVERRTWGGYLHQAVHDKPPLSNFCGPKTESGRRRRHSSQQSFTRFFILLFMTALHQRRFRHPCGRRLHCPFGVENSSVIRGEVYSTEMKLLSTMRSTGDSIGGPTDDSKQLRCPLELAKMGTNLLLLLPQQH